MALATKLVFCTSKSTAFEVVVDLEQTDNLVPQEPPNNPALLLVMMPSAKEKEVAPVMGAAAQLASGNDQGDH